MAAALDLVEIVLKECARIAPTPLYPIDFIQGTGLPRAIVDSVLDQLRLGGLLRLTEWTPAKGQGYTITEDGMRVLTTPRLLDRLRRDGVSPQAAEPALKPATASAEPTTYERGEAVRQALLEPGRPIVSQVLLFANIAVFLAGIIVAHFQQVPLNEFVMGKSTPQVNRVVHETGAIRKNDIYLFEEWWRLLSCCFVHFGLIHLGVNMYSLFVIGPLLERLWGHGRYLVLYLVAGMCGSCAIVAFSQGTGAGASGALWGLWGVMASLATWIYLNRHHMPRELAVAWYRQLGIVLLLNVMITFTIPNISAAGHFGGGIAGLAVGVPLHFSRFGRNSLQRWLAWAGVLVVPAAALAMIPLFVDGREHRLIFVQEFGRTLDGAHSEALVTYNKYVRNLLHGAGKRPKTALPEGARVDAALREIAKTQQTLKDALETLGEEGIFHNPEVSEILRVSNDYFTAWIDYYQLVSAILRRDLNWTAEQQKLVEDKEVELNKLEARWDEAVQNLTAGLR
jgi:membrane associated rhomboid family serine protease